MKKNRIKTFVLVSFLIIATCFAMAYAGRINPALDPIPRTVSHKNGIVSLSGKLTQNKIYTGGDGLVFLGLTITADDIRDTADVEDAARRRHVDMVIVLDRSGSMAGRKLSDARKAALNLIADLSPTDRFALVAYSDSAETLSALTPMTAFNYRRMSTAIGRISAAGGTNLGRGLQAGIDLLTSAEKNGLQLTLPAGIPSPGKTIMPYFTPAISSLVKPAGCS